MDQWLKTTTVAASGQTAAARGSKWKVAAVLALIAVGFFWRITLTKQYTWLESPDIARQVLPWFQMQVGELQQGRIPLWDPYSHGGQPLLGQAQPGVAYPLNWLLFFMPTRQGWMQEWILNAYFVLIHLIAMAFAYWLCRDWGANEFGSVAGACVFGLGAFLGHLDWPQMINGAVWAPAILLFVTRSLGGIRPLASAALGGCCGGLAILSGHHQVPIFLLLMAGGIWTWGALRYRRIDRLALISAALFFVVAVLISGIQSVPAWEYSKLAYRWVGLDNPVGHTDVVPYSIHQRYSMKPQEIFGVIFPGASEHVSTLLGFVAVLLAFVGVGRYWMKWQVKLAAVCSVSGLLFSMGGDNPFHGLIYSLLPVIDKARTPAMASIVFAAAVSPVVALGLNSLDEGVDERLPKWCLWFGGAVLTVSFLYGVLRNQWNFDPHGISTAIAALLAAALLHGLRQRVLLYGTVAVGLIGIILFELGHGPISYLPNRTETSVHQNLPRMGRDKEMVEALRKFDSYPRVNVSDELIPHNFGDWNGVDSYGGYLASLTRNYMDIEPFNSNTLWIYGVKYHIGKKPEPTWPQELYASDAGWKLYRNPEMPPLVRTVHQARAINSPDDLVQYRLSTDGGYREKVFVWGKAPELEQCGGDDELFLLRRESQRAAIFADMRCRGMVILADTYYPGWEAVIDGKAAPVWDAYTIVRGVVVEKGRHVIEMRFRPGSVRLGLGMTLAGLALTLGMVLVDGRYKP